MAKHGGSAPLGGAAPQIDKVTPLRGDVSSENEYINVMFWYLFLGKETQKKHILHTYTSLLRICPLAMASRVLVPAFIIEVSPN